MNNDLNYIKTRRSCRNYKEEQVRDQELQEIIECALLAPSGMDTQGMQILVIQNKDILNRLCELVGRDFIYNAPTLILLHAAKEYRYLLNDSACMMDNMYIASNALGLGACWINQLKDFPNSDVLNELGLKDEIVIASLALGYKSVEPKEREINRNRVKIIK